MLADELKKPIYQGLSDQAAADLLNALTITKRRLVPTAIAKQYAIEEGFYPRIVIDSQSSLDSAKQELCLGVWLWVDDPTGKISNIDMDLPIAKKMVAGLLHYQYITHQQAIGLDNLANQAVRWIDDVGIGSVSADMVKVAREEVSGVAEARRTMLKDGADRWNQFVNAVQNWDGISTPPVL